MAVHTSIADRTQPTVMRSSSYGIGGTVAIMPLEFPRWLFEYGARSTLQRANQELWLVLTGIGLGYKML